jgi:ABC-type branched-subunit amino acid transport system ATPase component
VNSISEAAAVSTAPEPLVSLANAGVRRDGTWLVRGVDLAVRPGEIVTLIGPNGSGKSTTAKMALGIHAPDEGTARRRPDVRVAYVPQKVSVDWTLPLTVERFLSLTARVKAADAEAALTATGIPHLRHAEVRNLSGGEFQRALLARAICRKPDLLVLDEPVQGVDYSGEIALYDLIKRDSRRSWLRRASDLPRPACRDGGDRSCDLPERTCLLPGRAGCRRLQRGVSAPVRRARVGHAGGLRTSSRPHPSPGRSRASCRRHDHRPLPCP